MNDFQYHGYRLQFTDWKYVEGGGFNAQWLAFPNDSSLKPLHVNVHSEIDREESKLAQFGAGLLAMRAIIDDPLQEFTK